jgi:hypothetical protein
MTTFPRPAHGNRRTASTRRSRVRRPNPRGARIRRSSAAGRADFGRLGGVPDQVREWNGRSLHARVRGSGRSGRDATRLRYLIAQAWGASVQQHVTSWPLRDEPPRDSRPEVPPAPDCDRCRWAATLLRRALRNRYDGGRACGNAGQPRGCGPRTTAAGVPPESPKRSSTLPTSPRSSSGCALQLPAVHRRFEASCWTLADRERSTARVQLEEDANWRHGAASARTPTAAPSIGSARLRFQPRVQPRIRLPATTPSGLREG